MNQGLVMLDLKGEELDGHEEKLLEHRATGGVILFSRNFSSADQLHGLIDSVRKIRSDLLIAVDHEGGRVQRFRGDGFTTLPEMRKLGKLHECNPALALELAEDCGRIAGFELAGFDIDINFAPVLDMDRNINRMLGTRCLDSNPVVIGKLSTSYLRGIRETGTQPVGKHFPGHGGVSADTHTTFARDSRTFEELQDDLLPFITAIEQSISGIMPSHVVYSRHCDQPAVFSRFWLQDILRKKLNFTGAVFSDCLTMTAASAGGSFAERAKSALEAGCDMVLVCNNHQGAIQVLEMMEKYTPEQARAVRLQALRRQTRPHSHINRNEIKKKLEHYFANSGTG